MKPNHFILAAGLSGLAGLVAHAGVTITVDHLGNDAARPGFKLPNVPPPAAANAARNAKVTMVDGASDVAGGDVTKLTDAQLPGQADDPGENFFFNAGTPGGRLRFDFGSSLPVRQVNTYSWHPGMRGPQVYDLYASTGAGAAFNLAPQMGTDPATCGWRLLARVDTTSPNASENGGQYGVSIADTDGTLGKFRYLLFDVSRTEEADSFGNTFYSEINVITNGPPAAPVAVEPPLQFDVKTADGKCAITINTAAAPELQAWAHDQLAPVLAEWYPRIVAILPSADYTAPDHFSITLKPMDGVAYTAGNRVVANSVWLKSELGREAIGSLIHEAVHVAQQLGGHGGETPGWIVEGTADYIRWFKYEPQSHGADLIWLRRRRDFSGHYDDSYRITANFLNWVADKYDPNIVTQLNAAMREGSYDASLWSHFTGKTAPELGAEWRAAMDAQLAPAGTPRR